MSEWMFHQSSWHPPSCSHPHANFLYLCVCVFLNAHKLFTTRRGARYYLPGVSCGTPTFFGLKEAEYLLGKEGRMPACLPACLSIQRSKNRADQAKTLMPWTFPNSTPRFYQSVNLDTVCTSPTLSPTLPHPQNNEQLLIRPRVNYGSNLRLEQDSHFLVKSRYTVFNCGEILASYRTKMSLGAIIEESDKDSELRMRRPGFSFWLGLF